MCDDAIARAVLEATAFQVEKVLKAMQKDSGTKLFVLKADGGMTSNELLMHFQSCILDCRGTLQVPNPLQPLLCLAKKGRERTG